jgi:glucosamine--fructose-6-phosphate aminotransferase (isomerizing)
VTRGLTDLLPGAPDPWAPSRMPAVRAGPPYLMTEMIEAEPGLAERLVRRLADADAAGSVARWLTDAARAGDPIETFGCGTSDHAAEATAAILSDALELPAGREVGHRQALDVAGRPLWRGVAIAISHEGGTAVTRRALDATRRAGARTVLVTVSARSPGAALADAVIATDEQDQSWCHTVGYLSPLLAATTLAALIHGRVPAPHAIADLLVPGQHIDGAEAVGRALAASRSVIVAGNGVDYPTARELALKIAEGARIPALALDVETVLHGHLAAASEATALVAILTDPTAGAPLLLERTKRLLRAAAALGIPAGAILASELDWDVDDDLTPAGRLLVRPAAHVTPVVRSALGAAVPLQLIAERTARARGVNPDTLGRDDPRQAAAHE